MKSVHDGPLNQKSIRDTLSAWDHKFSAFSYGNIMWHKSIVRTTLSIFNKSCQLLLRLEDGLLDIHQFESSLKIFGETLSNKFKLRCNQHFVAHALQILFIANCCGGNLLPIKVHKSDDYNLIKREISFNVFHSLRQWRVKKVSFFFTGARKKNNQRERSRNYFFYCRNEI